MARLNTSFSFLSRNKISFCKKVDKPIVYTEFLDCINISESRGYMRFNSKQWSKMSFLKISPVLCMIETNTIKYLSFSKDSIICSLNILNKFEILGLS